MKISWSWNMQRRIANSRKRLASRETGFPQSVQHLENRTLLTVASLFQDSQLTVLIEEGDDSVAIDTNPTNPQFVRVSINGFPDPSISPILAADVGSILVIGSDGANNIDLSGVNPTDFSFVNPLTNQPVQITVDAGNGDDIIQASSGFNDNIDAGHGDDTVNPLVSTTLTGMLTIDGGDGQDTINGGFAADVINAGDGADVINGGDGDDTIDAGDGEDDVRGGAGNDEIDAGTGMDTVRGDGGNDVITGGDGEDSIDGNDGDDTLTGGALNDTINGGFGDDSISGEGGRDLIDGGFNADFIDGNSGFDTLIGGGGNDLIIGGLGDDSINGGQDNDSIYGASGNDQLFGDEGTDFVFGQAGNDTVDGGEGQDSVDGGNGADVVRGGGVPVTPFPEIIIDDVLFTETGTFINSANPTTVAQPSFIALGDINGDGQTDVVVTSAATFVMPAVPLNNVQVLTGNGMGGLGPGGLTTADNTSQGVAIGDFDNANGLDVVVANATSDNFSVFFNDGLGNLGAATAIGVTQGDALFEVETGDLNNDGFADIVATKSGSNEVTVLLNNQMGGFGAADTAVGMTPLGLELADINGDTFLDVIVANSGSGTISVLINNGAGGLTEIALTVGGSPQAVATGDFDGDMDIDIAVVDQANQLVQILSNDGAGALGIVGSAQIPPSSVDIEAADLDMDGDIDLVVSSTFNDLISTLINDDINPGTFLAGAQFTSPTNPMDIELGDLNNDGLPDIIVGHSVGNNVEVLINDSVDNQDVFFTVSVFGDFTQDVSVDFATSDGIAIQSDDYISNSQTLTFTPGTTTQQIPITILSDLIQEPAEDYTLTLTNPVNAIIRDDIGIGVIADDDGGTPTPLLRISDVMVIETNANRTTAVFTVDLLGTAAAPVSVNYFTEDGTATEGSDYIGQTGSLSLSAAQPSQTITIEIPGETNPEADETFYVVLAANTGGGAIIADSRGLGTILNDDGPLPGNVPGDSLEGGNGNDTLIGSRQDDLIVGSQGNDSIDGVFGDDTLYGGGGNDTLDGNAGNDSLIGNGGKDVLFGDVGDDTVIWRGIKDGNDTFAIEDGFDTLLVNTSSAGNSIMVGQDVSTLVISEGTKSIRVDGDPTGFVAGFERVEINGGNGNDGITIGAINNVGLFSLFINGGVGDDIITGAGANIGSAILFMDGGIGNDNITGTGGRDTITGGEGDDIINGDGGTDILSGGVGDDILDGGDGDDVLLGEDGNDNLMGGLGNDILDGGFLNDILDGGVGNDSLTGGFGDDFLNGNTGNDEASGGSGKDTLVGGSGDDTLRGGRNADILIGNAGNDKLDGDHGDDFIRGNAGNDVIDGGDGDDTLLGEDGNDGITGGDGDDSITGSLGDDTLVGGDGDDTFLGGAGRDIILGEDGNDILIGNGGVDTVNPGLGADFLHPTLNPGEIDVNFMLSLEMLAALDVNA
jgi:Ca2+-binding RTX toxin-like protein